MSERKTLYLDNAATSWPKPDSVYNAVDHYLRHNGRPIGRTTGAMADELNALVARLRVKLQQLVGASKSETVFSLNGTDALNLGIHGTLQPNDHVVTTVAEHNSVLRPLRHLEDLDIISVTRVECDSNGVVSAEEIKKSVQPNTRLVALTHCSNVTGAGNDVQTVGQFLKDTETLFLVDAAQSLGTRQLEFDQWGIDLLASPGHKGLLGPLGTGFLIVSEKGQKRLRPVRQGGTGASSDSDRHPSDFPDAFEPGNLNVPGLVGLTAGADFVLEHGVDQIRRHKLEIATRFVEELKLIQGIQLVGDLSHLDSGLVSFNLPIQAADVAAILDSSFGIQLRAGFHCASLIHSRIGTPQGCVRASFGYLNRLDDAVEAARAIKEIAQAI